MGPVVKLTSRLPASPPGAAVNCIGDPVSSVMRNHLPLGSMRMSASVVRAVARTEQRSDAPVICTAPVVSLSAGRVVRGVTCAMRGDGATISF